MRYLIAFCVAVSCLAASAQKVSGPFKMSDGPDYEARRSIVSDVIGTTESGTLIVRDQKKKLFLELVDRGGTVKKSVPLADLKYTKLKKTFVSGIILGNRLFLRFSAYDKGKKMAYGIIDEYDPATLSFLSNVATESTDLKGAKTVYWYGAGLSRAVDELSESGFYVSSYRNYVVDYSSSFSKDKDAPEMVSMRVYDNSFTLVWEKEYEIPYANELFNIRSVVVDDNGNTHLVGREYDSKGDKKRGTSSYRYHVLSFTDNGNAVKDNVIELNKKFITDLTIGLTAQQHLMAAGFYSNEGFASINGTFAMKVNVETGEVLESKMKEFDAEFLRMGMTEKEEKKADKKEAKGQDLEMPDYELDEIVFTPDGGCVLLAEQYYITTQTVTTSGPNGSMQTRTVIVYHYDDVIAVKIAEDCGIEWAQKIPKRQSSSTNIGPLSYLYGDCNGNMVFLYNKYDKRMAEVKATVISPTGEKEEYTVMKNERDELLLFPGWSSPLGNCELLLYSARGKMYQFSHLQVLK